MHAHKYLMRVCRMRSPEEARRVEGVDPWCACAAVQCVASSASEWWCEANQLDMGPIYSHDCLGRGPEAVA